MLKYMQNLHTHTIYCDGADTPEEMVITAIEKGISTLATSVTSFEMMNRMDEKGAVLNSAFAVSAAFTFAGHLAFTLAFDATYISSMIIGKLISGVCALILAIAIYKRADI